MASPRLGRLTAVAGAFVALSLAIAAPAWADTTFQLKQSNVTAAGFDTHSCDNIPGGPVNVSPEGKEVLPPKDQVYSSIEGLIQHFELIMTNRKWQAPVDEVYGATETANGELGYYIVSDGSGVAYRARTRPPSFIHFALFPHMIEGHQVSDVVAVLGSINIIAAELDR